MNRNHVGEARLVEPLQHERVEVGVQSMHEARRDAVSELAAVYVRISPQEFSDLAAVAAPDLSADAGPAHTDQVFAGRDVIHRALDWVPQNLGTVEWVVKHKAVLPIDVTPDVPADV